MVILIQLIICDIRAKITTDRMLPMRSQMPINSDISISRDKNTTAVVIVVVADVVWVAI